MERGVDAAAIKDAARQTRLTAQQIDAVRQEHPIHWERMLLKRELRLAHHKRHGAVPDGITPGWPLGRTVNQIGPKLKRKDDALALKPRKLLKWSHACSRAL